MTMYPYDHIHPDEELQALIHSPNTKPSEDMVIHLAGY